LSAQSVEPLSEPLPAFEEDASAALQPPPFMSAVLAENSIAGEQLRVLASRVRAVSRERRLRTIGVVSATPGEGKTTVSVGLARTLALGGPESVLLVEADLRRPGLDKTLGFSPPSIGVLQHLEGARAPLVTRRLAHGGGCWVLSAGKGSLRKPEALASPRMIALLEAATRAFGYVVLDCPPLMTVADTVILQDRIDGFVLVVRSRHAPREAVLRAASLLKPGAVLGTVFNAQRQIIKPRYYG